MQNKNPNPHLTNKQIEKIKKRHICAIVIASIILVLSIAGMVCTILFLK